MQEKNVVTIDYLGDPERFADFLNPLFLILHPGRHRIMDQRQLQALPLRFQPDHFL